MDFQALINSINESSARDRGNYHLTYGELVKTLKSAPPDAVFDERVNGIGSWRGSYTEIALFTGAEGYSAEKSEFDGYGSDNVSAVYSDWEKENVVSGDRMPTNANELGALLESLVGLQFVGYKGGNFTIEEWKPLWLELDSSTCGHTAVVGIDEQMTLLTKELDA